MIDNIEYGLILPLILFGIGMILPRHRKFSIFTGWVFILSGVSIFIVKNNIFDKLAAEWKIIIQAQTFSIALVAIGIILGHLYSRLSCPSSPNKKRKLLMKLEGLKDDVKAKDIFNSYTACLDWKNRVAPLLKWVDEQYFQNFLQFSHYLNSEIAYDLDGDDYINGMISQVDMAISELKNS